MSSIDNKIVNLQLRSKGFQKGAADALKTLGRLKEGLNFSGAAKGLAEVESTSRGITFGTMGSAVDGIRLKFDALQVAAITALTNIVNKGVDAGMELAKALTIDAKQAGFDEYELKMGSIQTIMAGSGEDLDTVNQKLNELNLYADKTIYSFQDMTSNIGKFTNAGVDLDTSVDAIQGVANVAAVSGANADEASRAMYNFSQALSAGHVKLIDWKSIELANMATAEFKTELLESGVAAGTLTKDVDGMYRTLEGTPVSATKGFNESLQEQWLTAEALTDTLGRYSDETTEIGKKAFAAAQDIKTGSQMIDTWKEAAASGWAMTFEHLVGDFEEAKKLWTGINDVVGGAIDAQAKARNDMLKEWKDFGGRTALLEGLGNIFESLMNIVRPIKEAFREVFPPTTGKQLASITKAFRDLTERFKIGGETAEKIKRIFKGVFSIFGIGKTIVTSIASSFMSLFSVLTGIGGGGGGFLSGMLDMVAAVADLATGFRNWLNESKAIETFFAKIDAARNSVLEPFANGVRLIGEAFGLLFQGDLDGFFATMLKSVSGFEPAVNKLKDHFGGLLEYLSVATDRLSGFMKSAGSRALAPIIAGLDLLREGFNSLASLLDFDIDFGINADGLAQAVDDADVLKKAGAGAASTWDGLSNIFSKIGNIFGPIAEALGSFFTTVTNKITEFIQGMDFTQAVQLLNIGILTALYLAIRNFVTKLSGLVGDISDMFTGILEVFDTVGDSIRETLGAVTDTLSTMQQNVKASMILKIAIALGLLAASVWVLSNIDTEKLIKAMTALGLLLGSLVGTMALFNKIDFSQNAGVARAAFALILLAGAVAILTIAVKALSGLKWEELAKGLIGVGVLLAALTLFTKFSEAGSGAVAQATGLLVLSAAILLLSVAVEKFGKMDIPSMVKGLAAVTLLLAALGGVTKLMSGATGIVKASIGMLILSAALVALYFAMKPFIGMPWAEFAKGLGMVALALAGVGLAMQLMPKGMVVSAAGLILVSLALLGLVTVMKLIATMSIEDIVTALISLAGALGIIAIAMMAMSGTVAGAAALTLVSIAIMLLIPALVGLLGIGWEGIGILAGLFAVLGLAGVMAAAVAPGLMALGIAVGLLGIAMLAAGLGMLAFGTGFALLASAGVAGVAVLVAAFEGILALIPVFMEQIALGLLAFADVIKRSGPAIVDALSTVLASLLQAIRNNIPLAVDLIGDLIMALVNKIRDLIPEIAAAAADMMIEFLDVIAEKVPEMVEKATDAVTNFIDGITDALPRIVESARTLVKTFVDEVATAIEEDIPWIVGRVKTMAYQMILGLVEELKALAWMVVDAATSVVADGWNAAMSWLGIKSPSRKWMEIGKWSVLGLAGGLDDNEKRSTQSAKKVGQAALEAMSQSMRDISDIVDADMTMRPTITPVIDLTEVKKGLTKIDSDFGKKPLDISASRSSAKDADRRIHEVAERLSRMSHEQNEKLRPEIRLEQNNYSPKALNTAEIYRQTKNQISTLKRKVDG